MSKEEKIERILGWVKGDNKDGFDLIPRDDYASMYAALQAWKAWPVLHEENNQILATTSARLNETLQ